VVLIEDILVVAEAAKNLPGFPRKENTSPSCFRPLIVHSVVEAADGLCSLMDRSSWEGTLLLAIGGWGLRIFVIAD
jgi:hypothetical protein